MRSHQYQVCLRALDDHTNPEMDFLVSNHDDIFAIVERLKYLSDLDKDEAAALGVGLKLFTGVSLKYRGLVPFDALQPAMRTFVQALKKNDCRSGKPRKMKSVVVKCFWPLQSFA